MRILHTADWHLGKRLEHLSRLPEQREVLDEICTIADNEQVDMVIIAGDIFDTFNPAIEAIDLFYRTLKRLSNQGRRPIIAIAGNHDSPERIEAPDPLAREYGILLLGYPATHVVPFRTSQGVQVRKAAPGFAEIIIPGVQHPVCILWTPYANESRVRTYLGNNDPEAELRLLLRNAWKEHADTYCSENSANVLVAHLFMVRNGDPQPEEPEEEKPILFVGGAQPVFSEDIPASIQYVALGHLHRKQTIDSAICPVVYSGSPIAYSMAEANQQKSVTIADIRPGQPAACRDIPLTKGRRLLRMRFEDIEDAVQWLTANRDAIVELTMVSDTFLRNEERQELTNAHGGIIAIIPETAGMHDEAATIANTVDLSKSREELFIEYFRYKHGQVPNEAMMHLFREACSVEDAP